MQRTKVEWADLSSNPLKFRFPEEAKPMNLCIKVAKGCKNCYAETITKRFSRTVRRIGGFTARSMQASRPVLIKSELDKLRNFNLFGRQYGRPFVTGTNKPIIFLGDMTDLFGPWMRYGIMKSILQVVEYRDDCTFVMLTKRPKNILRYWPYQYIDGQKIMINLPNVILGTSVADQKDAEKYIPHLRQAKSCCGGLLVSAEPLLGPIKLDFTDLDWLIVGGESGTSARPCDAAWIRDLIIQSSAARIPIFVKQLGTKAFDSEHLISVDLKALKAEICNKIDAGSKGSDVTKWPTGLHVREFPKCLEID